MPATSTAVSSCFDNHTYIQNTVHVAAGNCFGMLYWYRNRKHTRTIRIAKTSILARRPRQAAWTLSAISHSRISLSLLAFSTANAALELSRYRLNSVGIESTKHARDRSFARQQCRLVNIFSSFNQLNWQP